MSREVWTLPETLNSGQAWMLFPDVSLSELKGGKVKHWDCAAEEEKEKAWTEDRDVRRSRIKAEDKQMFQKS